MTIEHVHVVWFGFDLVLPVSLPASAGELPVESDDQAVLVQAVPEWAAPRPDKAMAAVVLPVLPLALEAETAVPRVVPSVAPIGWAFLCDSARHERSGVQLC